jgi:hypothetical protein
MEMPKASFRKKIDSFLTSIPTDDAINEALKI